MQLASTRRMRTRVSHDKQMRCVTNQFVRMTNTLLVGHSDILLWISGYGGVVVVVVVKYALHPLSFVINAKVSFFP